MKAVRFIRTGRPAEIVDIPRPTPGPGQVVLKIAGAGVCHSDLHILDEDLGLKGPFVLGHENAGWIQALGQGVEGWKEGDPVAVYGPWGCGRCRTCQSSAENYCDNHASLGTMGGGLGADGGMAEYMLVPSARQLVALGGLDPVRAAPLSDAALTPYHAIKQALPLLTPEATVVVIGIGGLGHMAVQLLKALTPATLIAADNDPAKLDHARQLGASHALDTRDGDAAAEAIGKIAGPRGATVVLDFVGAQATVDLGARVVGRNSRLTVVGLGGGVVHYAANRPPYGCQVTVPYWGSRTELMEVISLAQDGHIRTEVETFPLEQALDVYRRLREGKIRGRAVLLP
ncbi:alcohol dehydrogenase [Pseudoxanthomonas broegbernensis]|uniref:alcohol dehydrogenase n=1 Tax=Pseudoxanthomonas broegbernensis TaxID=83619 RepID=A0A7V8K7A8_9GAMM|nr:NAD(P)-dependent alcohol dehydrogenase [Pseudoxanthomonas broegbernensis]KAF1686900.1 alcohol dehydrogenase [Pseudoxanthomonas broegbernensis]MBB6065506.1 propanol-preferring alcohol dehydrogenase [Pseudoxanthomonas broegbernensis]